MIAGQRICMVLLTGLGDVVHGLPIANALKRAGVAHITWVAEPAPAEVLRHHPAIDEIVIYHKKQGSRGVLRLARDLKKTRFDVTLNLNTYFKSVWPTLLSGAPTRIGFDRARSHDGVWLSVNHHLQPRPRAHTQDLFLEFLDAAHVVRPDPLEWRIEFTEQERARQQELLQPLRGRPIISVAVASATVKKDWPVERYPPLIDRLTQLYDAHVLLVGGPSQREAELVQTILKSAQHKPLNTLGNDVRRMMALVAASDLLIAPDTGPVHVARACEVPVVGLYGHTNPWRVGPYQKYQDLWIDRYTDGAPDPANRTPKWDRMPRITVDDVLDRVSVAFANYIGVHEKKA